MALAALQGLHQIVKEKETEIESLNSCLAKLEDLVSSLADNRQVATK